MIESDIPRPISEEDLSMVQSGESWHDNAVVGGLALALVFAIMSARRVVSATGDGLEVEQSIQSEYQMDTDFNRKEFLTSPLE